jgi:hypothetical protein
MPPDKVPDVFAKDQLPVILSHLDDARRVIEGGKVRRWEVFKWTFALNIVLASAPFAGCSLGQQKITPWAFIVSGLLTSLMGGALIAHYDKRIHFARLRANKLSEWIKDHFIDAHAVMGEAKRMRAEDRDQVEKALFFCGIAASLLAITVAVSLK